MRPHQQKLLIFALRLLRAPKGRKNVAQGTICPVAFNQEPWRRAPRRLYVVWRTVLSETQNRCSSSFQEGVRGWRVRVQARGWTAPSPLLIQGGEPRNTFSR